MTRPIVTYTCETWILSIRDINNFSIFERQILRKIFGPTGSKEGWSVRSNNKLQNLRKWEDIVKYIKVQRIKWWGHLNRIEDIKLVKKITDWNPIGIRNEGRPKNKWRYKVINDLQKVKLRSWIQLITGGKAWNDLVQKTKTHVGL